MVTDLSLNKYNIFFALLVMIHCIGGQTPAPVTLEPSQAPTSDYSNLNFDSCVIGHNIDGGTIIVSLSRNSDNDMVEIKMEGPDGAWYGVGMFCVNECVINYLLLFIDND